MTPPITSRPGIPASQPEAIEQTQTAPIQDSGQQPKEAGSEGVGDMSMSSMFPSEYNDFNMWLPLGYAQSTNPKLFAWAKENQPALTDVDWAKKPTFFPGVKGQVVLLVFNPYGRGGANKDLGEQTAATLRMQGASEVRVLPTNPDPEVNRFQIKQEIDKLYQEHGQKVFIKVAGGDGTITDGLAAAKGVVDKVLAVGFIKGGTAVDLDVVTDSSKKGSIIGRMSVHDAIVNGDTTYPVAHSITMPGGVASSSFAGEEEQRAKYQRAAKEYLNTAQEKFRTDPSSLVAKVNLALAERLHRLSCNKLVAAFFINSKFIREVPDYLLGRRGFSADITLKIPGAEPLKYKLHNLLDVALLALRRIGATFDFPLLPGNMGLLAIPRRVHSLFSGLLDSLVFRKFFDLSDGLWGVPKTLFSSLPPGSSVTIEARDATGVGEVFTLNGDVMTAKGGVKTLEVKVNAADVPVTMGPTSPVARSQFRIVSLVDRLYTQANAARVLSQYPKTVIRSFIPQEHQAQFFKEGTFTMENLKAYFNSKEGRANIAVVPELSDFIRSNSYFNTATANTVARHMGRSMGAGLVVGLIGHDLLGQTESYLARSAVNIGAMLVPDMLLNPGMLSTMVAGPSAFLKGMLINVGVGTFGAGVAREMAVVAGVERDSFKFHAASLVGATTTTLAMAYDTTRKLQLAATVAAAQATTVAVTAASAGAATVTAATAATVTAATATVTAATATAATVTTAAATTATAVGASVSVEAAATGAARVAGAARVLKLSPIILGAGLASDAVNAYAERNWRNQKETGLRADARKIYLDQNVEDAFGSHDDMTRRAAGLAQFVGVNLVAQALSPSLVDYGQDLSDYLTDDSTRNRLRNKEKGSLTALGANN